MTEVVAPPAPPAPAVGLPAVLRSAFRDPIWVDAIAPTLAIRVALMALGLLLVVVFRVDALPKDDFLAIWNRWDAPHFLEVARYGYGPPADPARIVLFPFYPVLIAVGSLVVSPLVAGMAISLLASVAAAAGIYRLARFDHGRRTARAAVIAMSVFPTAFAFIAPYSEAPFLALVVWSFVAARRDNWPAAGFLGMLAGATRLQGAFLLPALAVEYIVTKRRVGRESLWIALAAGGPLIYLAINAATFGDPLFFLSIQRDVFHVQSIAPWTALGGLVSGVVSGGRGEFWATVYLAPLGAFVVLGLTAIWTIAGRGARPSYAAFAILNLASLVTLSWPISVPRYILGVAPMFIYLGRLARRPILGLLLLVTSVVLLGVCLTLFVIGHWAF
jgi:hypothetical protein